MIAKTFEKFNYITVTICVLLLLGISIYYSTLEIKWSFFESQILNVLIIFTSFLLTSYSIDTVTRELTVERSGRNALHLILYPLVIFSYPIESVDLRFIISSALIFSAWRNYRIFLETNRDDQRIKRLLDTSLLLSLSVFLILDNILLFIIPVLIYFTANTKKDVKHVILLTITPLVFVSSVYIFLEFFSQESYLFSSFLIGDDFTFLSKPVFSQTQVPFALICCYYLIAFIAKIRRASSFERRSLDLAGIFFFFTPFIFSLSILGVIYTSLTAIRQTDLKRIIAYASVAHMNLVLIGMFVFNTQGLEGSILQQLSHGLVSGALFLCVGVIYDRHHTRLVKYYSGLAHTMPIYIAIFMFFSMANIALPGTSSFVGEFLILVGAFQTNTTVCVLSATGMILGGGYSLWLFNRVAFGNIKIQYMSQFSDINRRELATLLPLTILTLVMGIYPEIFLDPMHVSCNNLLEHINLFN